MKTTKQQRAELRERLNNGYIGPSMTDTILDLLDDADAYADLTGAIDSLPSQRNKENLQ